MSGRGAGGAPQPLELAQIPVPAVEPSPAQATRRPYPFEFDIDAPTSGAEGCSAATQEEKAVLVRPIDLYPRPTRVRDPDRDAPITAI